MKEQDQLINDPVCEYKFDSANHVHTYIDKPLLGTSTVVGVLAKNLTWWSAELSAVECLEAGIEIPTIREEYLQACASADKKKAIDALQKKYPIFKTARFAHFVKKNETAKEGTDLHAELEKYVKDCISAKAILTFESGMYHPRIKPFVEWCIEKVDSFIWSEAHCYSTQLWVGGITDCGIKLKDGTTGIVDFKSAKESYDSHFIQCAGYDIQVSENGGFSQQGYPLFKLEKPLDFYAIVPFGALDFKIDFRYNTKELREAFKATVVLYKLTNH